MAKVIFEIKDSYKMMIYHSEMSCFSLGCKGVLVTLVFRSQNQARLCTAVPQPWFPAVAALFYISNAHVQFTP